MADELGAVAEPIEQTTAEPTAEETAQPVAGEEQPQETAETQPAEEVSGDGRTLPASIKALKGVNAEAYEAAKRAFFAEKDYAQQFPGGIKEARETLAFLAEQGGREGIQQLAADVQDYRGLTEAMAKGDVPSVLDRVSEVAPEFIAQAAPEMLSRFYQTAPEECNALLCGVVAKSLSDSTIPQQLFEASLALRYAERDPQLAQNPLLNDLKTAIQQISNSVNAFSNAARQPQAQQGAPQQKDRFAQREAELNQRETEQMVGNYRTQMTSYMEPVVRDEAKALGYDLTDRQMAMLYKEVAEAADKAVGKDAIKLIDGQLSRKDVAGAVKMAQSRYGQVLKDVIKREAGELFRMPTKPKPAAPAPAVASKPNGNVPAVPGRPVSSFAQRFQKALA